MSWIRLIVILNICALFCWGSVSQAAEHGKLAFVRNGNIWLADSDGSQVRELTHSHQDHGPALSPDGKWVAYYSGVGEQTGFGQIFLIPSQGGLIQEFHHPEIQGGEHPAFAPDGKSLIFVGLSDLKVKQGREGELSWATMSLTLAALSGGTVRRIISHPHVNLARGYVYSNPNFSADGRFIAYQEGGREVRGGFEVINLQGKRVFHFPRSARRSASYRRPQFFPDGKEILCYSPALSASGADIIYRVNLASGQKTAVVLGSNPTLVDQGKAMVYERWPGNRRPAGEGVEAPDLWRLELQPGAIPRMIVADAAEPAGQMP